MYDEKQQEDTEQAQENGASQNADQVEQAKPESDNDGAGEVGN